MLCISGTHECTGCGKCKEIQPVMYDSYGEPIYEGDPYYEIGDTVLSEESLEQFKQFA